MKVSSGKMLLCFGCRLDFTEWESGSGFFQGEVKCVLAENRFANALWCAYHMPFLSFCQDLKPPWRRHHIYSKELSTKSAERPCSACDVFLQSSAKTYKTVCFATCSASGEDSEQAIYSKKVGHSGQQTQNGCNHCSPLPRTGRLKVTLFVSTLCLN